MSLKNKDFVQEAKEVRHDFEQWMSTVHKPIVVCSQGWYILIKILDH
jgi:hypothetical protein